MINKAKICPVCGAKNKSDEWKYALAALLTVCIVICLFAAYKGNQSEPVSTANNPHTKENIVYEDEYIKIDYKNLVEYDAVKLMFYLDLKVTNKTNGLINVHISDMIVNTMEVSTDLFGYVSDLDSGYSVMKRIGISFGAADIQSVNEINKIKFTAEIIDAETYNLIFKTDYINVNF